LLVEIRIAIQGIEKTIVAILQVQDYGRPKGAMSEEQSRKHIRLSMEGCSYEGQQGGVVEDSAFRTKVT
jgi:hypothetical protein